MAIFITKTLTLIITVFQIEKYQFETQLLYCVLFLTIFSIQAVKLNLNYTNLPEFQYTEFN